jgi:hypothetical protein
MQSGLYVLGASILPFDPERDFGPPPEPHVLTL